MTYIESQIFKAAPYPLSPENSGDDKNGQIKIKIHGARGESNWLNVSPAQLAQIENILNNGG